MTAPGCPRCNGVVALHEGRPAVTGAGHVALWHRDCWDLRDVPLPAAEAALAIAPRRASRAALVAALGWRGARAAGALVARGARIGGALVARGARVGGVLGWRGARIGGSLGWRGALWTGAALATRRGAAVAAGLCALVAGAKLVMDSIPIDGADAPSLLLASREPLVVQGAMPGHEVSPPREGGIAHKRIDASDEVPIVDGVALDELFPSLKEWIHPVTASAEYMPTFGPRLFGSERIGIERAECGEGHCGVDLDGPRGRPIVSVASGTVANVERREMGGDGRSGRYVRIRHTDSTFTAYMHMDDVADGLNVGDSVSRGQYLGTLGATAVYSAPPHLHFSLEVPSSDARGEYVPTRYVNPAPFLMRSRIVPVIERPTRPALN